MQCPNCGTWYADTHIICTACGDILTDGDNPPRLGSYRIAARIGKGGVGTVYRGYDESKGNREVAVKVLHHFLLDNDESVARFRREAEMQGQLDHANVVKLLDIFEKDHALALIMESLEGCTLREYLADFPVFTPGQMRTVGEAILLGLQNAHEQHITHRDLKPSNIFICDDGRIKVMDFGLAKSKKGESHDVTSAGTMVGSYHYMAPEQILGRDPDARTDLYAFGILLYRMATGKLPFESTGGGEFEVMEKQVRHMPERPSEVMPGIPYVVEDLIMELLVKEPDQRPQSCGEVLAGLQFFGTREDLKPYQKKKKKEPGDDVSQLMLSTNGHLAGASDDEIPELSILGAFKHHSPVAPSKPPMDLCTPPAMDVETLKRLRSTVAGIPPLPAIWYRTHLMVSDSDTTPTDLAKEIEPIAPLTKLILTIANSRAYTPPGSKPVNEVALAITRMGMDNVHDLILQATVPDFGLKQKTSPDVRSVWFHSRSIALFSRILSEFTPIVDHNSASLFGMIHDIGKLVILHAESDQQLRTLKEAITSGKPTLQAEWETLGYTHIDAGIMLALHWKLPRSMHRFIFHHHHPCWLSPEQWPADMQAVIMLLHTTEITIESMMAHAYRPGIWSADKRSHIPASLKMLQRPLGIPVVDTALYTTLNQELKRLMLTFPDLFQRKQA